MKSPTSENLQQLKNKINKALDAGAKPLAAFDADGTLWNFDAGENFFQYKIDKAVVPLPADPWAHYEMLKKKSHPEAYLWLAQILKGKSIDQVRHWAKDAVTNYSGGVPAFKWMQEIIQHLQAAKVEIYIVTASITWAVEPAAEILGIPASHVIGIETRVENNIVTHEQNGAITWREGKVEGLLSRTGGVKPFFAAGNTMGDFHLIEAATHVQVVNATVGQDHQNYETEQELRRIAASRRWSLLQP